MINFLRGALGVGGGEGSVDRFIYPNCWRPGQRKVCKIENPYYYQSYFATSLEKGVVVLALIMICVFNSSSNLKPSPIELSLMDQLYMECDINEDGAIQNAELACFPFDQQAENFVLVDTNEDGISSRAEFRRFLVEITLRPLARQSGPRYIFSEILRILLQHARREVSRKQAVEILEELSPYFTFTDEGVLEPEYA
mmetsp:Transcript_24027/g.38618  ORF Transcript_24027/g.38618 Transcript_24027/m.38618 type:complete len:197 (+) Transcript_24027:54-644(+)|eukprot:jgi/Bigna1/71960/fgenesh1_pg.17_\